MRSVANTDVNGMHFAVLYRSPGARPALCDDFYAKRDLRVLCSFLSLAPRTEEGEELVLRAASHGHDVRARRFVSFYSRPPHLPTHVMCLHEMLISQSAPRDCVCHRLLGAGAR